MIGTRNIPIQAGQAFDVSNSLETLHVDSILEATLEHVGGSRGMEVYGVVKHSTPLYTVPLGLLCVSYLNVSRQNPLSAASSCRFVVQRA